MAGADKREDGSRDDPSDRGGTAARRRNGGIAGQFRLHGATSPWCGRDGASGSVAIVAAAALCGMALSIVLFPFGPIVTGLLVGVVIATPGHLAGLGEARKSTFVRSLSIVAGTYLALFLVFSLIAPFFAFGSNIATPFVENVWRHFPTFPDTVSSNAAAIKARFGSGQAEFYYSLLLISVLALPLSLVPTAVWVRDCVASGRVLSRQISTKEELADRPAERGMFLLALGMMILIAMLSIVAGTLEALWVVASRDWRFARGTLAGMQMGGDVFTAAFVSIKLIYQWWWQIIGQFSLFLLAALVVTK